MSNYATTVTPAVPSSGAVSMSHVRASFPGVGNHLDSFHGRHPSLPASGAISIGSFKGLTAPTPTFSNWQSATASGTNAALAGGGAITGTVVSGTPSTLSLNMASYLDAPSYNPGCTYAVVGGNALPAGVTLAPSTGALVVNVTSATAGTQSTFVRATNAYSNFCSIPLTFNFLQPTPTWGVYAVAGSNVAVSSGGAITGLAASASLAASLSVQLTSFISNSAVEGTMTFAVTSGALPSGLTLTSGGLMQVAATSATSGTFSVTATNGGGGQATTAFTVAIAPAAAQLSTQATGAAPETVYVTSNAQTVGLASMFSGCTSYAFASGGNPQGTASISGSNLIIQGAAGATAALYYNVVVTGTNGVQSLSATVPVLQVASGSAWGAIAPTAATGPNPGLSFGNSQYWMSSGIVSSGYGNGSGTIPFTSAAWTYGSNVGSYIGFPDYYNYSGPNVTLINGGMSTLVGEWIQIQLPSTGLVTSYTMQQGSGGAAPSTWALLGTRDATLTSWTVLHQQSTPTAYSASPLTYMISSTFQWYRFVILTTNGGAAGTLQSLQLNTAFQLLDPVLCIVPQFYSSTYSDAQAVSTLGYFQGVNCGLAGGPTFKSTGGGTGGTLAYLNFTNNGSNLNTSGNNADYSCKLSAGGDVLALGTRFQAATNGGWSIVLVASVGSNTLVPGSTYPSTNLVSFTTSDGLSSGISLNGLYSTSTWGLFTSSIRADGNSTWSSSNANVAQNTWHTFVATSSSAYLDGAAFASYTKLATNSSVLTGVQLGQAMAGTYSATVKIAALLVFDYVLTSSEVSLLTSRLSSMTAANCATALPFVRSSLNDPVLSPYGGGSGAGGSIVALSPASPATSPTPNYMANNLTTINLANVFSQCTTYAVTTNPYGNASVSGATLSIQGASRGATYGVVVTGANAAGATVRTCFPVVEAASSTTYAYPPVAATYNSTVTLAGSAYGNGCYVYTNSWGGANNAFNTTGWDTSGGHTYDGAYGPGAYLPSGAYNGGYGTAYGGSNTLRGDWVTVELPCRILCTSYSFQQGASTTAPVTWALLGTNDHTQAGWTLLHLQGTPASYSATPISFATSSPAFYRLYRFVVLTNAGANGALVSSLTLFSPMIGAASYDLVLPAAGPQAPGPIQTLLGVSGMQSSYVQATPSLSNSGGGFSGTLPYLTISGSNLQVGNFMSSGSLNGSLRCMAATNKGWSVAVLLNSFMYANTYGYNLLAMTDYNGTYVPLLSDVFGVFQSALSFNGGAAAGWEVAVYTQTTTKDYYYSSNTSYSNNTMVTNVRTQNNYSRDIIFNQVYIGGVPGGPSAPMQLGAMLYFDYPLGSTEVAAVTSYLSNLSASNFLQGPVPLRNAVLSNVALYNPSVALAGATPPVVSQSLGSVSLATNSATASYSLDSYFSSPSGTSLAYFVTSPYSNATINGHMLTVVANGRNATYNVTVAASNAQGYGTPSTLSVTEAAFSNPFTGAMPGGNLGYRQQFISYGNTSYILTGSADATNNTGGCFFQYGVNATNWFGSYATAAPYAYGGVATTPGYPNGSWFQVQTSVPVAISAYNVCSTGSGSAACASEWYVLGSIDGVSWSTLDHQSYGSPFSMSNCGGYPYLTMSTFPVSGASGASGASYFRFLLVRGGGISAGFQSGQFFYSVGGNNSIPAHA